MLRSENFLIRYRRYVLGALLIHLAALLLFTGLRSYYVHRVSKDAERDVDVIVIAMSATLQGYINELAVLADTVRSATADDGHLSGGERDELVHVARHVLERDPVALCSWIWLEPDAAHGDAAYAQNANYPEQGRFFVSFVRRPENRIVRTFDLVPSNRELRQPDGMSFYLEALRRSDLWIDVDTAGYTYGGVLKDPVTMVTLSYPVVGAEVPHKVYGVVGLDFPSDRFLAPHVDAAVRIPHNFIVVKSDETLICVTSSGFGSLGANIQDPTRVWQDDLVALASVIRTSQTAKVTQRVGDRWIRSVPLYYTTPYSKGVRYVIASVVLHKEDVYREGTRQALRTTLLAFVLVLLGWTYIYIQLFDL